MTSGIRLRSGQLESSPTGRQRIGQHMLALATYLGHVNINATYCYLGTTPELLLDSAVAAETLVGGGPHCPGSHRTWRNSPAGLWPASGAPADTLAIRTPTAS